MKGGKGVGGSAVEERRGKVDRMGRKEEVKEEVITVFLRSFLFFLTLFLLLFIFSCFCLFPLDSEYLILFWFSFLFLLIFFVFV